MRRERLGHTLEPTALVHEAWLRLVGEAPATVHGRSHFLAVSRPPVTAETRRCPFCPDRHRPRLHGTYERHVLLPGEEPTRRFRIRRLLCRARGKTVSSMPDFCLPHRQYGVGVLGHLLHGLVVEQVGLWRALRAARRDVPGHAVAQALGRG